MNNTKVLTPKFRVSWPNVFEAKVNMLSKQEEYSLVALFEKGEDLSSLKAAIKAAAEKKFGTDQKKWPKMKSPLRLQDEKEKDGVMPAGMVKGAYFLTLKSKQKPAVVDQNVQPILDAREIYSGCYARASINAFAYDNAGNRGVSFGLMNIQKLDDGDPLGTRSRPQDDFAPIEVGGVDESPKSAEDMFS